MLVGGDDGDLPARELRQIGHLVQEHTLHATGVADRMSAIDEFHE